MEDCQVIDNTGMTKNLLLAKQNLLNEELDEQ